MDSIAGAWKLLIVTGAGTGTVLILRWYWWRINAWSEVSSMAAAFVVSVVLQTRFHLDSDDPVQFAHIILITVAITTVVWLAATFLTAPETDATLLGFYRRVRPFVAGWGPVARLAPEVQRVERSRLESARLAVRLRADLWCAVRNRQDYPEGLRRPASRSSRSPSSRPAAIYLGSLAPRLVVGNGVDE